MDQNKINQLSNILKRLNAGENPQRVKKETQEFLASVGPEELAAAEQQLVEAGLAPEDLRHLCSAHMEMMGGELAAMKAKLPQGHMIHTFVIEHEIILEFLSALEALNQTVQKSAERDAVQSTLGELNGLVDNLIGAEPHHKREEDVLFPEVEARGLSGPPRIMRMEHIDLRHRKRELKDILGIAAQIDFVSFRKKLDAASKLLVLTLRDHIFKENNILYPAAIQIIPEPEVWKRMKIECDKIGYCAFTPKVG